MAVRDENAKQSCLLGCAATGGLVGIAAMALIFFVGEEYGSAASIFLGGVAGIVVTLLMIFLFCRELPEPPVMARSAAPKPTPAPSPAPTPAPAPAPSPEPAPAPAAAEADAGADAGDKPTGLSEARDGKADNLKEIKGVGPKLEKLLNSMGYYHFDQIAAWTAKEVAWVDENLEGFKGRVTRDGWVDQAKILASGGDTEFSKRVDKGDVY
ncbi:MAG: NADH:ubiquinone oxidoreductase [Pseudomonadota bacterium]